MSNAAGRWGTPEMLEDPFPFFADARVNRPVCPLPGRDDTVLVTRREDMEYVLMHPDTFSAKGRAGVGEGPGQRYPILPDLTMMDPPEHGAMRTAYLKLLAPRRIDELRPQIEAKAHALIDAFAEQREIELVSQYAQPLPAWVMGMLLGLEEAMHAQLDAWAMDYFELLEANRHAPSEIGQRQAQYGERIADFMNFCGDLVTAWRADPPDSYVGEFVMSRDLDGELYTIEQLANQVRLLITGAQTTANAIAQGVIDVARMEDRGDLDDDQHLQALIAESLRKDGPATYVPRLCLEDVELPSGQKVAKGTRLMMSVQSANHDESYYACPAHFDPERENLKRHLGFGRGIHFCVGAPLARVETAIALRALFSRFGGVRLSEDNNYAHRSDLAGVRLLKRVFVQLDPGAVNLHVDDAQVSR